MNRKNGIARFRLLCALIVAICALSIAAGAAEIVLKVITVTANVRQNPDLSSKVVRTVASGTLLSASTKEGEWYKVDLPAGPAGGALTGYVHESVVSVVAGAVPQAAAPQTAPAQAAAAPAVKKQEAPTPVAPPTPNVAQSIAPSARKAFIVRPYAKVGYLLTPPSAADLSYEVIGGDAEQYLDTSAMNFGGGAQFLMSMARNPNLRLGMDVGFQTLFSSKFDTGSADGKTIYEDYDKDSEFSINLLGIVEYLPADSNFLLQGGLGGHFVAWRWEHVYSSKYQDTDETKNGLGFNFALMAAAGLNLLAGERMNIPILLRLDYIMRYGGYINASVVVGFTF
jgi:hypothetical protein